MREMKDSGVDWIGNIPRNWDVIRVKDKYKYSTGFTPDTKRSDYYNDIDGYEWATISDINNDIIETPTKALISREYVNTTFRRQIVPGCLLYSFKLSVGQVAISDRPLFINEALAAFVPSLDNCINFLRYSSFLIEFNANTNIYGAKILNQQLINDAYVVFPPLDEQKRIASFLDSKCAEIDSITADIQKEIELLQEYRKSVITEAVTKGLDPDVEMKDSGVEWIGEIPNNWEIFRMKDLFSFSKGLSITKENLQEDGLPVVSYGQIHAKDNVVPYVKESFIRYVDLSYSLFKASKVSLNSFIFADTSEDYDGCGNNVYNANIPNLYGGYHTIIAEPKENKNFKYLSYLFMTPTWRSQIRVRVGGVKVLNHYLHSVVK